jgi:hypothetical protein
MQKYSRSSLDEGAQRPVERALDSRRAEKGVRIAPSFGVPQPRKIGREGDDEGKPHYRLLQMLDVGEHVPCPHLSTLDLSGSVNIKHLLKVLKARSKAGCRLGRLRLGKTHRHGGQF